MARMRLKLLWKRSGKHRMFDVWKTGSGGRFETADEIDTEVLIKVMG